MKQYERPCVSGSLRSGTLVCIAACVAIAVAPNFVAAVPCYGIEQPFCTYPNNYLAMVGDIGPLKMGTFFETWPDGSPTYAGQQLTPQMNYTSLGVTFSAPVGYPFIRAYGAGFKALEVDSGGFEGDWIIADFVTPASAVGIYFPGGTELFAYDASGALITSIFYFFPGGQDLFLGITSDVPIARAIVNGGGSGEVIDTFAFNVVPEPAMVGVLSGLLLLLRPRKYERRIASA